MVVDFNVDAYPNCGSEAVCAQLPLLSFAFRIGIEVGGCPSKSK